MKFRVIEDKDYRVGVLVEEGVEPSFGPGKKERERVGQQTLIRHLLGNLEPWEYEESGKPYFVNRSDRLSFTHSENVYACQIAAEMACGIDVQHYRDKISRVTEKFLNPVELDFVATVAPEQRIKTLTAMWSCKEALYKMHGAGFIDYINRFTIHPFRPVSGIVEATADLGAGNQTYLFRVEFTDAFVLAFHTLSATLPANDNERILPF